MYSVFSKTGTALAFVLLVGCQNPQVPTEEPDQQVQASAEQGQHRLISFESETYDRLWDAAGTAVSEGRLWAPAGNNAVEYYLQIRQGLVPTTPRQEQGKKAVEAALVDFTPLLTLAIDEAIEARQLQEASRLIRMLAAIDSQHPALARQIDQVRKAATPNTTSQ